MIHVSVLFLSQRAFSLILSRFLALSLSTKTPRRYCRSGTSTFTFATTVTITTPPASTSTSTSTSTVTRSRQGAAAAADAGQEAEHRDVAARGGDPLVRGLLRPDEGLPLVARDAGPLVARRQHEGEAELRVRVAQLRRSAVVAARQRAASLSERLQATALVVQQRGVVCWASAASVELG